MKKISLIIISIVCFLTPLSQATFRFYVFDETATTNLHYTFEQDVSVQAFDADDQAWFVYRTNFRIKGINQKQFAIKTEFYKSYIPDDEFFQYFEQFRTLDTNELDLDSADKTTSGWIRLRNDRFDVTSSPNTKIRMTWQKSIDGFLAKFAPINQREIQTIVIEGDIVPAREIEFRELLSFPEKYDGKRIRLLGYYHRAFESSCFTPSKDSEHSYGKGRIWIGGRSTFADPAKISNVNDKMVIAEGTFNLRRKGHMGAYVGTLERLTTLKKSEPEH
jgi:hypothetical protein